jgi:hypothetical protein
MLNFEGPYARRPPILRIADASKSPATTIVKQRFIDIVKRDDSDGAPSPDGRHNYDFFMRIIA